jgi:hypothetical protein
VRLGKARIPRKIVRYGCAGFIKPLHPKDCNFVRRVQKLLSLDIRAQSRFAAFERRALMLRNSVNDSGNPIDRHQVEAEITHLVINMQTYWGNWCRSLFLSSCFGAHTTGGNIAISALPLVSDDDAITVAVKGALVPAPVLPWPSWKEPAWFSPSDLARIVGYAQLSNRASLVTVLNSMPPAIQHLRVSRNYLAHRNIALKQNALSIGPTYLIGSANSISEILLFVEPGRSISVIERWTYDLRRAARALCR